MPDLLRRHALWLGAGLALLLLVGRDFAFATTFLGDDYVFRAFASLERNPLVAFVVDKHGGEYYRPIPMLLWWVLERPGGGSPWPFAAVAFLLHLGCAGLLLMVARRLGLSLRTAVLAGALFFAAPAEREAALWFSASTDLLAAAAMLGSIAGWLAGGRAGHAISLCLAGVALLCKETALVLPLLVASVAWYRGGSCDRQESAKVPLGPIASAAAPYAALALAYLAVRWWVLRGIGGSNDPRAPWWAMGIQIAGGWVHAVSAYFPLPEWGAWLLGGSALAVSVFFLRRSRAAWLAMSWALLGVLPLPAAGWVVGARYFYFAAAGLMLLLALAIERFRMWLALLVMAVLLGLGAVAGTRRISDVRLYRRAVAAAQEAVVHGLASGSRLFLVRGAVKDLDLAIKLDPKVPAAVRDAVIIPDVPASFVWLPHAGAERLQFLLAEPPLPPSGAYRFEGERIVGLARREEAPDLDEVLSRLPDLRIVRLKLGSKQDSWEDCTSDYLGR